MLDAEAGRRGDDGVGWAAVMAAKKKAEVGAVLEPPELERQAIAWARRILRKGILEHLDDEAAADWFDGARAPGDSSGPRSGGTIRWLREGRLQTEVPASREAREALAELRAAVARAAAFVDEFPPADEGGGVTIDGSAAHLQRVVRLLEEANLVTRVSQKTGRCVPPGYPSDDPTRREVGIPQADDGWGSDEALRVFLLDHDEPKQGFFGAKKDGRPRLAGDKELAAIALLAGLRRYERATFDAFKKRLLSWIREARLRRLKPGRSAAAKRRRKSSNR